MSPNDLEIEQQTTSVREEIVVEVLHRLHEMPGPIKRVVSPEIQWLRDHREELKNNYPNEWLAVGEEGLHGHDRSLKCLYDSMKRKGLKDATYVHVSEPLSPR